MCRSGTVIVSLHWWCISLLYLHERKQEEAGEEKEHTEVMKSKYGVTHTSIQAAEHQAMLSFHIHVHWIHFSHLNVGHKLFMCRCIPAMLGTPAVPFELQHGLEPYHHWHEDDNSHPPVKIVLKTKVSTLHWCACVIPAVLPQLIPWKYW